MALQRTLVESAYQDRKLCLDESLRLRGVLESLLRECAPPMTPRSAPCDVVVQRHTPWESVVAVLAQAERLRIVYADEDVVAALWTTRVM